MAQLLQNIYNIAPVLFLLALLGATLGGFWLVIDLRKRSENSRYSMSERLFMKRNAARLRKMQLH